MATTYYGYSSGVYDTARLRDEIVAAGLPAPVDLQGGGYPAPGQPATAVSIGFDPDITPAQVTTLNAVVAAHNGQPRRARRVAAIYADLTGLTATQQDAILADLQVSQVQGKWSQLSPPQDAPAAGLRWSAVSLSGATAGEKRQAGGWIAAMWCQQNPKYLVNPTFHASLSGVNIPGDEPVP